MKKQTVQEGRWIIVTHLKPGDPAPDFSLPSTSGKNISLSDFRGKKNVVVAFYPLDFTPG